MIEKAKGLFEKHGYNVANEICNSMITEFKIEWNQDKIDFWLDVKNELKKYQK